MKTTSKNSRRKSIPAAAICFVKIPLLFGNEFQNGICQFVIGIKRKSLLAILF